MTENIQSQKKIVRKRKIEIEEISPDDTADVLEKAFREFFLGEKNERN